MKVRTTLILLLLTGALLAFIATKEHRQPGTREKLASESRPFPLKPEDADEIEIERKEDTVRILFRDDTWRIAQPFDDAADPDVVKQLLETLSAMEWVQTLERKDLREEDFKRTGLGEDAVKLSLRHEGKLLAQAAFGAPAVLEGCVYAAVPSSKEQLHVAKTALPGLLNRTDDEWRDPRLARIKAEDIRHFTMNAGTGGMEFVRGPGEPWKMVRPIQTSAADARVTALINGFLTLKLKPSKAAASPTIAGSDLPDMQVIFEGENLAKPLSLTLHPIPGTTGEVLVRADHREGAFLAVAKAAWKLQPGDLRNQNIVRIPKDQATALRLRSLAHGDIVLDKKGDTWMLTRFGKVESANQERVAKLLDTLNATPVAEFLSDSGNNLESWGLDKPFLTIEWQAAGKTSALEFGQASGIFTARVRDEPFIYRPKTIQNGFDMFSAIPPDSLRWRTTKIVNVSIFAVHRIIVAEGDKPALTLLHNPDDASWSATIAGRDVTSQLDKERANQLLQKLAEFQASDWNSNHREALDALEKPSLTVQLLLGDPLHPKAELQPLSLAFAPFQPGANSEYYHGRKDQETDTFVISRDAYRELVAPVVK